MRPETLTEIFSILSRILNVLRGGSAEMTFCAAAGRDDPWYRDGIDRVFLLVLGEEDHCAAAWEHHLDRCQQALLEGLRKDAGQ